ncbi:MAG: putative inorganic carbon transporter subunit DabA, partial [Bacteroidota bacterium]
MLSKSLKTSLEKAAKKIAPLWPLESFVAVNPYLGMSHLTFQQAAQRLDKVGGGHMTLPTEFYLRALENDEVRRADVKAVLERTEALKSQRVENFLYQINSDTLEDPKALPAVSSLTDVATATTQRDWNQWTVDMLSSWASVYFDQGQIAWNPTQGEQSLYKAWRSEAIVNRTPDIHGLAAFRKEAKQLPEEPLEAAHYALNILGLPSVGIELYLHRLQTRILGWSSYIGYLDYQQQLYQKTEGAAQIEWLAVLLSTEALLLQSLMHTEVPQAWEGMRAQLMQL